MLGNQTGPEARVPVIRRGSSWKFADGLAVVVASMKMETENRIDTVVIVLFAGKKERKKKD